MRRLNISQLPPDQETGRCGIIRTVLGKGLTEWRNHVKTQITMSIKSDSICNITALTHTCIKTCSARPTMALYIRLTYIIRHLSSSRFILVKFSGLKEDEFWTKVDSSTKEIRKKCKTLGAIRDAYQAVYNNDRITYGEPDNSTYPLTAASALPVFVQDLNTALESRVQD
ncbi:hypothetical protein SCP_0802530 [Sparassis crispa]|uniref:Uncharacterized protein n=1 Tax=Sparassis crispa TaxID=139825 RepID=A0A401GU22_9APHY|nr:hypothetical protein SCP_0802530 [Sparassis crispa]GBE85731.1 hypothetical protein SCP_0802530 [Sparassis crispa]